MVRHSSRNLPLKLSLVPFCQGLPGSMSGPMFAFGDPPQDRPRDELRAVVRPQVARCAVNADQPGQHFDDSL